MERSLRLAIRPVRRLRAGWGESETVVVLELSSQLQVIPLQQPKGWKWEAGLARAPKAHLRLGMVPEGLLPPSAIQQAHSVREGLPANAWYGRLAVYRQWHGGELFALPGQAWELRVAERPAFCGPGQLAELWFWVEEAWWALKLSLSALV